MTDYAIKRDKYTWKDYLQWPDDKRCELIGGEVFAMTPPTTRHQFVSRELLVTLHNHLKKRKCEVFSAPIAVKFSEDDILEPDIVVVCDSKQIKSQCIEGPPSLVVEILSPSTARHDQLEKLQLYAKYQVHEYWIVMPYPPMVQILRLDGSSYRVENVFNEKDTLRTTSFPDLSIQLSKVFDFPADPEQDFPVVVKESAPPYTTASGKGNALV